MFLDLGGANFFDGIHAFNDAAEDGIGSAVALRLIQSAVIHNIYEELRSRGVRAQPRH